MSDFSTSDQNSFPFSAFLWTCCKKEIKKKKIICSLVQMYFQPEPELLQLLKAKSSEEETGTHLKQRRVTFCLFQGEERSSQTPQKTTHLRGVQTKLLDIFLQLSPGLDSLQQRWFQTFHLHRKKQQQQQKKAYCERKHHRLNVSDGLRCG